MTPTEVDSLAALARTTQGSGGNIRMRPGVHRMEEYLPDEVLQEIREDVDHSQPRPPVPMFVLRGDGNQVDLSGVTIEIDTTLYQKLPWGGYTRGIIIAGKGNTLEGVT